MPPPGDAVTLCSIDEAVGRRWRHVVLIGAVEGELPARRPVLRLDPAVLDGPFTGSELRLRWQRRERARFDEAVACASEQFSAVSAPEAGVLVSRFVEGLTVQPRLLAARHPDPQRWPQGLAETSSDVPLQRGPGLHLSATQLTMFENCPWQHTVQYRLGLRGQGGLAARFGSLVHAILERFLQPPADVITDVVTEPVTVFPRTLDGLIDLAAASWSDDIADYRPQAEDYRRRLDTILRNWWQNEGAGLVADGRVLAVEHEFAIEVGPHRLHGFIDRVDRVGDGIGVVDYKTGGTARSIASTQEDLQLAVYHLAATRDPQLRQHGPVRSLELNFIAAGTAGTVRTQVITAGHDMHTEHRIESLAQRMIAEEHEPSVAASCEYCDLHRLCPLQSRGRPVPVVIPVPAVTRRRPGKSR